MNAEKLEGMKDNQPVVVLLVKQWKCRNSDPDFAILQFCNFACNECEYYQKRRYCIRPKVQLQCNAKYLSCNGPIIN